MQFKESPSGLQDLDNCLSRKSDGNCLYNTLSDNIPPVIIDYQPCLPILANKGNTICCEVVSKLIENAHSPEFSFKNVFILDARYSFEYVGGHIRGARHVADFETFLNLFKHRVMELEGSQTCFIIHCEYSSKRGPNLISQIRQWDHNSNIEKYPSVYFPELYLLEGGYKQFYEKYPYLCEPQNYVEMTDSRFESQCKQQQRKKNKSISRSNSVLGVSPRTMSCNLSKFNYCDSPLESQDGTDIDEDFESFETDTWSNLTRDEDTFTCPTYSQSVGEFASLPVDEEPDPSPFRPRLLSLWQRSALSEDGLLLE